jgi:hypothetical protein
MFVAIITVEFFLGLDVLHAHDASMDMRCHDWTMKKCHCDAPTKVNSNLPET